jgi:hypothetical protein
VALAKSADTEEPGFPGLGLGAICDLIVQPSELDPDLAPTQLR